MGVATPPEWLGSTSLALPVLIAISVWQFCGFPMVVFLAAMDRIPQEVQDAASIDGVGTWSRLRFVTIPMTATVIAVMGVLAMIGGLKVFDIVVIMTGGGPGTSTDSLTFILWQEAFGYREVGYASSLAVLIAVLIGAVSLIYLRLIRPSRVEY